MIHESKSFGNTFRFFSYTENASIPYDRIYDDSICYERRRKMTWQCVERRISIIEAAAITKHDKSIISLS